MQLHGLEAYWGGGKAYGKTKVLVKVNPDGKYVVDLTRTDINNHAKPRG